MRLFQKQFCIPRIPLTLVVLMAGLLLTACENRGGDGPPEFPPRQPSPSNEGGENNNDDEGGNGSAPANYAVTTTVGEGGRISPTDIQVSEGQSADFTIEVDNGFELAQVEGCGGSLNGFTFATGEVTANCVITATFTDLRHTVTASVGQGGTLDPASQRVPPGKTTTFTLELRTGYEVDEITGCGATLDNNLITTGTISADCQVEVTFNALTVTEPENLTATGDDRELSLTWDAVTNANGYKVYWATSAGVQPGETGADWEKVEQAQALVDGLDNGTTYYIIVTAIIDELVESNPSSEVMALVQEPIEGYSYWPTDTGIDFCANDTDSNLACPVANFPGQDGEISGPDFGFTKLDTNGNLFDDSESEWHCVVDNNTGLTWEVKVDDSSSLHYFGHTYSWFQPDDPNGGDDGVQAPNDAACGGADCDTDSFVTKVNEVGLCGAKDWRLPTRQELLTLVDSGRSDPAIDTDYFQHIQSGTHDFYWSSDSVARSPAGAHQVAFRLGSTEIFTKGQPERVMLVRGDAK